MGHGSCPPGSASLAPLAAIVAGGGADASRSRGLPWGMDRGQCAVGMDSRHILCRAVSYAVGGGKIDS